MQYDCTFIPYRQTKSFSDIVYDYAEHNKKLQAFYAFEANLQGVEQAIAARSGQQVDRNALVAVLKEQYKSLDPIASVNNNIEALLDPKTFSICTAHQPNLLTGYLYFFYKILHAIQMADELNKQYPNNHFVPIYYMGSEDNDLEELGQFRYDGIKYNWDAKGQKGAVGRMKTESLKSLLDELFGRLDVSATYLDEFKQLVATAYLQHENIADATQFLVHKLFGHYGLVVLNPDEAVFKKMFSAMMHDDLFEHTALPIVHAQSELLAVDYKAQAFPRLINLFYLKGDIRERIEQTGDTWYVLNTNIRFTKSEMEDELANHPERFSPNVILRGLFQETILPNICFIGGGSELAYWLQLKPLFAHYRVFFPVLFLRQSVQIIQQAASKTIADLGLKDTEIFESEESILNKLIVAKKGNTWSLENEQNALSDTFKSLSHKAKSVDPTLEKSAQASLAKIQKQVAILEQKIYRAEKRKELDLQHKIKKMKAQIAPYGGMQERTENFIPYYIQDAFSVFNTIKEKLKPFDSQFLILHSQQ